MIDVSIYINSYEKYDWSNHSMLKCKFQKVNNFTTTTHAQLGDFDYITNGENNACPLMRDSLGSPGLDNEAWFPNPSC